MIHYYTNNSDLKSKEKEITIEFEKKTFKFVTDIGVFSKDKLDFGTEVMLKEILNDNPKQVDKILDIGCGYGVVSVILASYFKDSSFTLSDVNDRALKLANDNLVKNAVKEYELINSSSFDNIFTNFDVIISNPPIRAGKDTIFNIYENAHKHLNDKGCFYCVIQTKHGAKSTEKKLIEIFGNCVTLGIHSGYRVYRCVKS